MLTKHQQERIARRCSTAIIHAVDQLPRLLSDSEPEAAAALVADLIKAGITLPVAEESENLEDIVRNLNKDS